MIATAYSNAWIGSPGANDAARSFRNLTNALFVSPAVNQLVIVAGNRMIDDAKIGGITPAMFSCSGQ